VRSQSRSINIRHVAREGRVGVGTVSRVLNNSDEVSSETREHVWKVIHRLEYRPNAQARRILRRSEMIYFVLANRPFLHSFHAGILQGVEACAAELKQHVAFLVVHCEREASPDQIPLPPTLEERGWMDGVIIAGAVYPNLIRRIEALNVPLVVFGNNVFPPVDQRRVAQIRYDGSRAEFGATKYLIKLGHRRIAFVGDTQYPWFREQHQGYLKAMRANKLSPFSLITSGPEGFVAYGEWAATRVLKKKRVPTAIVTGNDEVAYGLCRSLRRMGLEVPGDISLIGFDDSELAALMDPPLTTVHVDAQEIGQRCLRLLLERLHHASTGSTARLVPTKLIERQSVKCLNSREFRKKPDVERRT
jgi:LacI family transcriptional regulator